MVKDRIDDEYFEWLCDHVCTDRIHTKRRYRKLLTQLHLTVFRYSIPNDSNREDDGLELRYRFGYEEGRSEEAKDLDGPCSVFEMLVALALRWEEDFMDNPIKGNRVGEWFWLMLFNMDIDRYSDDRFNKHSVLQKIDIFLDRRYSRSGNNGNIIVLQKDNRDLRNIEIWYQLCWYINEHERV